MMTKTSNYPYGETVERLKGAIVKAENTLFATIDQAEAAEKAGLSLRPTMLILFGSPKAGTPLMEACAPLGLDLPLKLQVWEDSGAVTVAYWQAEEIAARYDIAGFDLQLARIDAALDMLTDVVTH